MRADTDSQEFWSDSYRGHSIATLNHGSGWLVYLDHVLQADQGCDFDFLRYDGKSEDTLPLGLLHGWVGGW